MIDTSQLRFRRAWQILSRGVRGVIESAQQSKEVFEVHKAIDDIVNML